MCAHRLNYSTTGLPCGDVAKADGTWQRLMAWLFCLPLNIFAVVIGSCCRAQAGLEHIVSSKLSLAHGDPLASAVWDGRHRIIPSSELFGM